MVPDGFIHLLRFLETSAKSLSPEARSSVIDGRALTCPRMQRFPLSWSGAPHHPIINSLRGAEGPRGVRVLGQRPTRRRPNGTGVTLCCMSGPSAAGPRHSYAGIASRSRRIE